MFVDSQLGELIPLYKEYRGVIEGIEDGDVVRVAWNEQIVADNMKKALGKLGAGTTYEDFQRAMEKASYTMVPRRRHELIFHGFAGSIVDLFVELDAATDLTPDGELPEDLLQKIELHSQLPEEVRKGAIVTNESGYYYGGQFQPFEAQ